MLVSHFRRGQTPPPAPFRGSVEIIAGNRDHPEDLRAAFARSYDLVFDLSGYRLDQVTPLVQEHASKIGHFLFCSTSSVVIPAPPGTRRPYGEGAETVAPDQSYGGQKRASELLLLEAAQKKRLSITIFRPQAVLGKHDGAQAAAAFRFLKQRSAYKLPEQFAAARINLLEVCDLAQAFARAAGNPIAHGKIYNVANDEPVSLSEFIERCARAADLSPPSPRGDTIPISASDLSWWHDYDLVSDNALIKRDLGLVFTPLDDTLDTCWKEYRRPRWKKVLAAHIQKLLIRF